MSKKMTIPSLKHARPMPHWSIRARARDSVSAVVDPVVPGVLRVDHDLGAGALLDLVDDPLRPRRWRPGPKIPAKS